MPEGVEGSFHHVDERELFARALAVAERAESQRAEQETGELEALRSQGRTLDELSGIAEAAVAGRVRKLWMRRDAYVPGLLDPPTGEIVEDPREELLDTIALRALLTGAEVSLVDAKLLPSAPACALLR